MMYMPICLCVVRVHERRGQQRPEVSGSSERTVSCQMWAFGVELCSGRRVDALYH